VGKVSRYSYFWKETGVPKVAKNGNQTYLPILQANTFALKKTVETSSRFSDFKVGIREFSFPFMQEPTEK